MHPISHLWLTVCLGKLDFLSVTDFSLANLRRGNFIVWGLDMSSLPRSRCQYCHATQRGGALRDDTKKRLTGEGD